jgi:hypothetical protein
MMLRRPGEMCGRARWSAALIRWVSGGQMMRRGEFDGSKNGARASTPGSWLGRGML